MTNCGDCVYYRGLWWEEPCTSCDVYSNFCNVRYVPFGSLNVKEEIEL